MSSTLESEPTMLDWPAKMNTRTGEGAGVASLAARRQMDSVRSRESWSRGIGVMECEVV
ncbi:MAG: hypothetical protein RI897_600 [Verrucomicrobiota bacterium]